MNKPRLSFWEQIAKARRACAKAKDVDGVAYYDSLPADAVACVSWQTFKGSWAGKQWLAQRARAAAHRARMAPFDPIVYYKGQRM